MRKILILAAFLSMPVLAAPVTGIVVSLPVHNGAGGKFVTVENLIFTDQKIAKPTLFASFQQQESDSFEVACCVEVVDLTPVSLDALQKKYVTDIDFTDDTSHIKGYQFIYHTRFSRTSQNAWQKQLAASNGEDATPYMMPAIEGAITSDTVRSTFKINEAVVRIANKRVNGNKAADVVTFTIDGKKTVYAIPQQTGG